MTYALEVKELPTGQAPNAAPAPADDPSQQEPQNQRYDAPAWSGDVYEDGDESTPEESPWPFQGASGEQAWLDRSADGTITGWVRSPDGTVYRYTDPDQWAVEVDDAGMQSTGEGAGDGGELPAEGGDPNAADDPTAGDEFADAEGEEVDPNVPDDEMVDELYEDYASTEDDADDVDDAEVDPDADPDAEVDTPDEAPVEDDEDDTDDEDDAKKKRRGFEGKTLRLTYG